jgi:hypothetical protein
MLLNLDPGSTMDLDRIRGRLVVLRRDANKVVASLADSKHLFKGEGVNWADLHCCAASLVLTDEGEHYLQVVIEEVSPGAAGFKDAVATRLRVWGWLDIHVITEW